MNMKNLDSLDPENWDEMRALGHQMIDDMMDYLENIRDRPVWQPLPQAVRDHFKQPIPVKGQNIQDIYQEFMDNILPYPLGNIHPGFWGWVVGTGTPFGALAEFLAATMNPNVKGGEQAPRLVELQVLDWCKTMFGFPESASGLLTSGGSMANFYGLAAARNSNATFDIRNKGLSEAPQKMVMFASSETHSSVIKAAEQLGIGQEGVILVAVDNNFRMDLVDLERNYDESIKRGEHPFCVVGTAGTVNTGAIDPLDKIADFCNQKGLWFHVDGAFGAFARFIPEKTRDIQGLERADSLAFDLHKWMSMPIEVGCILVRNESKHLQSFQLTPAYLAKSSGGGITGSETWLADYGLQLSRGFRALKVWMSIKEHGLEKYRRMIQKNYTQMQHLGELISSHRDLELMAPVSLNVVCFRYLDQDMNLEELNQLNAEIVEGLQTSGIAAPSSTYLYGQFAIRAANVNHRTQIEDLKAFVQAVIQLGEELT